MAPKPRSSSRSTAKSTPRSTAKKMPRPAKKLSSPAHRAKPARKETAARAKNGVAPRRARKASPRRSPLYGMSLEAFIDRLAGWQVTLVRRLIALVRKAAPGATAAIKWGQPVFESDGPFAFIRPAKTHVTFGFWRGSELIDQKGVLSGSGSKMKHLKIGAADRIDDRLLSAFVRQAVALNRAHGTPA